MPIKAKHASWGSMFSYSIRQNKKEFSFNFARIKGRVTSSKFFFDVVKSEKRLNLKIKGS